MVCIATGRQYPEPVHVHLSPAFAWLAHAVGAFPVSEALADQSRSLPIFPGMTEGELEAAVEALARFLARG